MSLLEDIGVHISKELITQTPKNATDRNVLSAKFIRDNVMTGKVIRTGSELIEYMGSPTSGDGYLVNSVTLPSDTPSTFALGGHKKLIGIGRPTITIPSGKRLVWTGSAPYNCLIEGIHFVGQGYDEFIVVHSNRTADFSSANIEIRDCTASKVVSAILVTGATGANKSPKFTITRGSFDKCGREGSHSPVSMDWNITSLVIDGTTFTDSFSNVIHVHGAESANPYVAVRDVKIKGFQRNGIEYFGLSGGFVTNTEVDARWNDAGEQPTAWGDGIAISFDGSNNHAFKCHVKHFPWIGIEIVNGSHSSVKNCIIDTWTSRGASITCLGVSVDKMNRAEISNNIFRNINHGSVEAFCIQLIGSLLSPAIHTKIFGNTFHNSLHCVRLHDSYVGSSVITENTAVFGTATDNRKVVVDIRGGTGPSGKNIVMNNRGYNALGRDPLEVAFHLAVDATAEAYVGGSSHITGPAGFGGQGNNYVFE